MSSDVHKVDGELGAATGENVGGFSSYQRKQDKSKRNLGHFNFKFLMIFGQLLAFFFKGPVSREMCRVCARAVCCLIRHILTLPRVYCTESSFWRSGPTVSSQ